MENASSNKSAGTTEGSQFELIGGAAALDLVNTLDWRFRQGQPEELITNYERLVQFVVQSGLITAADGRRLLRTTSANKADQVVEETRELREAAARVFYSAVDGNSPSGEAIRELERCFKGAEDHRCLHWSDGRLQWEFPAVLIAPELPVWILSIETAKLITSQNMQVVRACGNPECRWLFLDTSKNHTRRWCDMKICGNRMKARRFKAQHRRGSLSKDGKHL